MWGLSFFLYISSFMVRISFILTRTFLPVCLGCVMSPLFLSCLGTLMANIYIFFIYMFSLIFMFTLRPIFPFLLFLRFHESAFDSICRFSVILLIFFLQFFFIYFFIGFISSILTHKCFSQCIVFVSSASSYRIFLWPSWRTFVFSYCFMFYSFIFLFSGSFYCFILHFFPTFFLF